MAPQQNVLTDDMVIVITMELLDGTVTNYSTVYTYLDNPELIEDNSTKYTITR